MHSEGAAGNPLLVGKTIAGMKKGILAIVALAATIAVLAVLARYLDGGFTVLQQVYLRVFAALLLAIVVFRKYIRWGVVAALPMREWGVIAFRGIAGYAFGVALMTQAVTMTTIGNVTFIAALPVVPLLGFILLKEKVTWWKIVFIFGSLLGVALMAMNELGNVFSWHPGDVVAVVSTLGLGLSYIGRKWHSAALNNQEITMLTFVFGAVSVLLPSLIIGEGVPPLGASWAMWLAIVVGGALSLLKLFMANYGFQHLGAVQAGNLLTLEGAWGVLFGLLFYSEWPTWQGLLGGVIIVVCVIGMNKYTKRGDAKMVVPPEGIH